MSAARSYIPPAEIGEVMRALAAGRVIASRHPGFAPGDWVHGRFGVQEHAVSDGQMPSSEPRRSYLDTKDLIAIATSIGHLPHRFL